MKYFIFLYFIAIMNLFPQIKGKVIDSSTSKPVNDVNIYVNNNQMPVKNDLSGSFNLNLKNDNNIITFRSAGYKTLKLNVSKTNTEYLIIKMVPSPYTTEEINVTSAKYETAITDVPLPMEVVTEKNISQTDPVTVSDILSDKPGLNLVRDGIWGTSINIRGLSRANIVTLIDGNRIETATDISAGLSLIDVNNIKRIEVIKGASSSLYGTGATGGIVNIITKSGQYSNSISTNGSINSSYNSVNNNGAGSIYLNVGGPSYYLDISGALRKADNVKTPRGTLQNSQYQDDSYTIGFGIKPLTNQELKVNYQRFYANNVGIPGGGSAFPANALVRYPTEERRLFDAEYNISNISDNLLNLSLKYFYQYIYRDVENLPFSATPKTGTPPKQSFVMSITPNARHYTNGLQLQSNWLLGINNVVFGIDAWQRQLDSRRERNLKVFTYNAAGDSVVKIQNQIVGERPLPESNFRSIGAYLQDEIDIIKDVFKLTAGGRYDQIRITNNQVSNPVYIIVDNVRNNNPASQTINWASENIDNNSWSADLGLLYYLNENMNLNLSAARSFRSPSLEERYKYIDNGNVIDLGNPDLKPEDGWFLNGGIKSFNSEMTFTADVFLNELKNLVVSEPGTFNGRKALINENVGKARLYGFDLSANWMFYKYNSIYLTSSYVKGRDINNDKYLPQIPAYNGKLGIKYNVVNILNADLSATIYGNQKDIAAGEIQTPGYTYYDLYLSSMPISFSKINLTLFGGIENITDKAYRNHLSTNRGSLNIEPGRNFFIKLNLAW